MEKILDYLSKHDEADSLDLAKNFNVDHQKIVGAIKSLENFEDVSFLNLYFWLMIISVYWFYTTHL